MTGTLSRGAANQAGARLNANGFAEANDFLPPNGLDHADFRSRAEQPCDLFLRYGARSDD